MDYKLPNLPEPEVTGTCELCGEDTTTYDQAEVVNRATGEHKLAHVEGCHDASTYDENSEWVYA